MSIIQVIADHKDIVPWCEEHISKVLWKDSGEWHGMGWCIEVSSLEYDDDDNIKSQFTVDIDDEYQATLFALTWV